MESEGSGCVPDTVNAAEVAGLFDVDGSSDAVMDGRVLVSSWIVSDDDDEDDENDDDEGGTDECAISVAVIWVAIANEEDDEAGDEGAGRVVAPWSTSGEGARKE